MEFELHPKSQLFCSDLEWCLKSRQKVRISDFSGFPMADIRIVTVVVLQNNKPFLHVCLMIICKKKLCVSATFSNVKYQDLCATINLSKIKYLQNQKQSLKYLCNINLIGFLQKQDLK